MNVTLNERFQKLIKHLVESGEFETDDEVVQAGLYLLEKRQQKLDALRKDIQDGLASGVAGPFDDDAVERIIAKGREKLEKEQSE